MSHPATAVVVAVPVGAYLVGSVPTAWLVGRWRGGVDLRTVGSGNPGTSNLFRNAGFGPAAVSGPLQFAQGLVPALVARAVGGDQMLIEVTAVCAVAGNGWPVWLRFRGQRSIAVATGAATGLHAGLLAVLLVCFAAGALSRTIAAGVLAGFLLLPVAAAWIGGRHLAITCCVLLAAVVLRRLDGVVADMQRAGSGGPWRVMVRRLVLDERPGQVLVGPRDA